MVRLWTRQNIKCLQELHINGVIRIKRKHLEEKFDDISDYIINVYDWFIKAAEKKIPRPKEVEFPIWCSVSEENMLRPTPDEAVFVLEVKENEVVYFDGAKWDYVLNHHYIPKDEADKIEYEAELEERGFKNAFSFIHGEKAHLYPEERKRITDSWNRIFDIDKWDIFNVQANIWEIRPEMIKEILYYK